MTPQSLADFLATYTPKQWAIAAPRTGFTVVFDELLYPRPDFVWAPVRVVETRESVRRQEAML